MYISVVELKKAFEDHLKIYLGYSDAEAQIASSDFSDPYSNFYLNEDYLCEVEIEGEEYEMNASKADFSMFGDDTPAFCFYTFYKTSQIEGHTVEEYKSADRLFQIDDLDMDDFE